MKNEISQQDNSYSKEKITLYSNKELLEFEKILSKEMQGIGVDNSQYNELLHTYNKLHEELLNRGLVKFPF